MKIISRFLLLSLILLGNVLFLYGGAFFHENSHRVVNAYGGARTELLPSVSPFGWKTSGLYSEGGDVNRVLDWHILVDVLSGVTLPFLWLFQVAVSIYAYKSFSPGVVVQ